jgi:ribosomal protein L32
MIITTAISAIRRQINNFFFFPPIAPQISMAGIPFCDITTSLTTNYDVDTSSSRSPLEEALWFAVPKKKVTRGKKRLKTTLQKRISMKNNIVIDKRTGELTLKHKLPYNWENYLPENAEHAP